MSAMICGIAAYHYWRIFGQFADGGTWNEGYRYADWLLTVPLLVAELVVVSGLSKEAAKKVTPRLVVAALLMIATGYPGETAAAGSSTRTVWGIISSIFMLYVLYELFAGEVGKSLKSQSGEVGSKLNNVRYLLLFTWGVYPITFIMAMNDVGAPSFDAVVSREIGYSIADILAKCVFGLIIFTVARIKSAEESKEFAAAELRD